MKIFLATLFATFATAAYSQVEIKTPAELKNHIGDSVRYCGVVASARLMDRMTNAPAFLNIDEVYPRQTLTVIVWAYDRKNFTEAPEKFYLSKKVCIMGKLEKFKEQLQIPVHSEAQLAVQQ